MKRSLLILVLVLGLLAVVAGTALAGSGNPSGTGPPNQSCQDQFTSGGSAPGNSAGSPGSPFNEPGFGSTNGGTGGQNYSGSSQYDVACYQLNNPPPNP